MACPNLNSSSHSWPARAEALTKRDLRLRNQKYRLVEPDDRQKRFFELQSIAMTASRFLFEHVPAPPAIADCTAH